MKKNKQAVSLVIVMGIVLVTSLLALTIIELIIPFSRSVSGMENSSKAYYLANSGIEEAMLNLKEKNSNPSKSIEDGNKKFNVTENKLTNDNKLTNIFTEIKSETVGKSEPKEGQGDSEFDKNYNTISVGNPIQMELESIGPRELKIEFKVPNINGLTYELNKDDCYISWQLSSEGGFISSNERNCIKKDKINGRSFFLDELTLDKNLSKIYLSDGTNKDVDFEEANGLLCEYYICTIKFSIINELKGSYSSRFVNLPYLEWKGISPISSRKIKLRYATIDSKGKSYGFVKDLFVRVPQNTVNEAFDFTVFQ